MNRVFLSHSSEQIDIVKRLADIVGQDRCIVDCYDFRAGEELEKEITRKIDQSGIFCLLISDSALSSDWVTKEVQYVREKVESKKILFRAFIIDSNVTLSDYRISPWVKNYLLHTIPSPIIMGRVLSDNLRELDYNNYPSLKLRDSLFIGRGQALSNLETEHVLKSGVKAIVVSGIPHVGKKRFSLQYLRKVTNDDRLNFCIISLERGKSIEDLALFINDFVELYTKDILLNILVSEQISQKIDCVINLINKLFDYHQTLLISDDFCIIQRDGNVVDWFREILKSPDLQNHAGIYIVSKIGVSQKNINQLPLVQQSLLPLDSRDIKAIVKAYSRGQGLAIPNDDIITISSSVKGFPGFVYPIIDSWVKHNRYVAFDKMRDLEKGVADLLEYIVDVLNDSNNKNKIQLLLLLAYFELMSIKQLQDLYDADDDLEKMLNEFHELSILEYFGVSREYVRIHPVVADFLRRSKRLSLSKEFIEKISKRASDVVKEIETPEYEEDITTYIFGIKQMLKNGISTEKDISRYMIPSLALNVIVEEYEAKNYSGVLTLCDRMLSGTKNYDEHIERSIRYWQCLAYCRVKDKQLFDAISYFKGHYTYHFLLGFYYRMKELWGDAEKEYKNALKMTSESSDNKKLKQELVLVRIKRGDYKGAVLLAEENYKTQRFNPFFIEAYFRCLVKDPYSDPIVLKRLISDMEKSQDKKHIEIANTMKAEYAYYFEGNFGEAIKILQGTIEHYPGIQYTREAFSTICKDAKKPEIYRDFMKRFGA